MLLLCLSESFLPLPLGALVNAAAVLLGGSIGLLLQRSLPERLRRIALVAVGLCTLLIGMQMALQVSGLLSVIFSMIIGGLIGESLDLHGRLETLSDGLRRRLGGWGSGKPRQSVADLQATDLAQSAESASVPSENLAGTAALDEAEAQKARFSEGLITAFLVFCVGSMTIVGSLKEGISGDASLIYAKSLLDGFTSIALASTFGVGVLFSVIPLLILQAGLTWVGALAGQAADAGMISQLTAVGGLLILALGLNLLEIRKIKVSNLLPALLVVAALEAMLRLLGR